MVLTYVTVTEDFDQWTDVIRRSFITVAQAFGLSEELVPSHGAFIKVETLHRMHQRGVVFFGLMADGLPVGFVAIKKGQGPDYRLEKLAVLPSYRHCGLGKGLVEKGVRYVMSQGGGNMTIGVIEDHTDLVNWYRGMGFVTCKSKSFKHLPYRVCFMKRPIEKGNQ